MSGELFVADPELSNKLSHGLGQLGLRRLAPQAVKIVKFPHRFVEDVNNDVGKIDQGPVTALRPFDGKRLYSFFRGVFFDALRDALNLAIGTAGTDDEIIGNGGVLVNVQYNEIAGFFVESETSQEKSFFPGADIRQDITVDCGRCCYRGRAA